MNLTDSELITINALCLNAYEADRLDDTDYHLLNISDKIEKYLGIE